MLAPSLSGARQQTLGFDRAFRPLLQALAASLVLHGLVLLGGFFSLPTPVHVPSAALRVVVMPGNASPHVAPASVPETSAHPAAPPLHPAVPPLPPSHMREAKTPHDAQPILAMAGDPHASQRVVEVAPASTPPTAARATASEAAVADAAPASAPSAAREGVSADAMREYRLALAIQARRFKRYPALARERVWEGVAEIAVAGGLAGVPLVSLARSSGYRVLDEQALDMLGRAAQATPLPDALRGREFRLVVPVRFSLDSD
ncbi:TonB family protein [Rhodocyclus tenuis]|uniref:TonB family protein n=1 Tax=Rhodocyclus gracilis TaxID=2929842 RepID=A0ABX0WJY3_9RHOO|nr:TonB family protein [Rhodocyclus gracilis]MRD73115.1 TonB family protein [Rhodocyclus gracilis]NJA89107.1 TonB family protein [Rhodocyclus gracilis]